MRSMAMALLLLVACGEDSDPHELTTCVGWTDNAGTPIEGMCEQACKMPPPSTGLQCDTPAKLGCAAFEASGVDGCCVQEQGGPIKFVECTTIPQ